MSTGWITWACLMLATGAPGAPDEVVHINQRGFKIPIRVLPERRAEVHELMLYLSRDQGRTWEIHGRATPDKDSFEFFAPGDGLFYFSIASIDRKGKQDPADVYRAPVGQRIFIDTTKPVVKIVNAERVGDEVQVSWEARDERPEWTSLRLEYKVGDQPTSPWTPLGIQPGERGNYRFRPGQPGPVTLRLRLRDLAGNEGGDERLVSSNGMQQDRSSGVMRTAASFPGPPAINGSNTGVNPPPPSFEDAHHSVPVQSVPSNSVASSAGNSNVGALVSPPVPAPVVTPPAGPTRSSLPALQIVNKRQVKLGFEVGRFGPSGLGSVDVYVTTDEGANWERSAADPNVSLPVTSEARGQSPVHGTVTVNLPKDGVIYGFYLIVKSRAGLGKAPPHPGDAPQVRIEVDTTLPNAELYAPVPDAARRDRLILSWKAEDRNLAPNPISLEWAIAPGGPWTFIGDPQLPNTGRYSWQVPDNIPPKVYLRLSVRDTAGNNAIAQTDQPVVIDVILPELAGVKLMPSP